MSTTVGAVTQPAGSLIARQVGDFHRSFELPLRTRPTVEVGSDQVSLRLALIEEEVGELRAAAEAGDLIGVADALADIVYVAYGSAHVYGIDLDAVLDEVHASNMTKLGGDGRPVRRPDGKVLKGPCYRAPDVAAVLARAGYGTGNGPGFPRARYPGSMTTKLGQWMKKLTTDDETVDAADLSSEVDASGCQHAAGCWQGQRVSIIGRLRTVDLRPTDAVATLHAELYDGTDSVSLIWLGRRSIPGVETGRTVKAKGRLAMRDGHKVIYNPDYELLPAHA